MYDKERVIITTPSPSHLSTSYLQCESRYPHMQYYTVRTMAYTGDEEVNHGFIASMAGFFTSILYKLGSFLYLTAAAILCLDVIVLHR